MSWIKLDDRFADHPKIIKAGPTAAWLFTCGLCYCAKYLTDGLIPKAQVRKLADIEDWKQSESKLLSTGLWEDAGDSWMVHDYLDYNMSREQSQALSAKRAEAGSRGGRPSKTKANQKQNESKSKAVPVPVPVPVFVPVPDPVPGEIAAKPPRTRTPFKAPTPEEAEAVFSEKGFPGLGVKFVAHYESVGWKRQGTTITNWRACITTWCESERNKPRKNGNQGVNQALVAELVAKGVLET